MAVQWSPEGLGTSHGKVWGQSIPGALGRECGQEQKMQSPRRDKLGIAKEKKEATEASWEPGLREGERRAWRGHGWRRELSPARHKAREGSWKPVPGRVPHLQPGQESTAGLRTRQGSVGRPRGGGGLALVAVVRGGCR